MQQTIDEYHAQGLTDKDIVIYPVGRKVAETAKKRGYTCVYPYPHLADKPNSEECRNIAKELGQKWLDGEFDKVEIIYHHFKSQVARFSSVRISFRLTLRKNSMLTLRVTFHRISQPRQHRNISRGKDSPLRRGQIMRLSFL